MNNFKKALVTGGAGFIGSHLCEELLNNGLSVVVLDNLLTGKKENLPDGVEFVQDDILDREKVKEIILNKNIDIIFHQAAVVTIRGSVDNFYSDAMVNIMGTLNILHSLSGSNVKKFIYASSMAVYSDSENCLPINEYHEKIPLSPYGISKLASEKYCLMICRQNNINCTVLRYFNTFGPRQIFTPYVGVITIFVNNIISGKDIFIFGDGEQCRDFVHVSDIVQGNIKAMLSRNSNGIFNIGTGISTSVNRLSFLIMDKMNKRVNIVKKDAHSAELRNSVADISKAREIMGYTPLKKIEDSLEDVIKQYR